jgi:hypothetical protein
LKLELDSAKKALKARCAENEALRDGMKKLFKQLQVLQYMESVVSQEALFYRNWIHQMSHNPACEACAYLTMQPASNTHPPPPIRPECRTDSEDKHELGKHAQSTEDHDEPSNSPKIHTQAHGIA